MDCCWLLKFRAGPETGRQEGNPVDSVTCLIFHVTVLKERLVLWARFAASYWDTFSVESKG